jgi:hypothetical protein
MKVTMGPFGGLSGATVSAWFEQLDSASQPHSFHDFVSQVYNQCFGRFVSFWLRSSVHLGSPRPCSIPSNHQRQRYFHLQESFWRENSCSCFLWHECYPEYSQRLENWHCGRQWFSHLQQPCVKALSQQTRFRWRPVFKSRETGRLVHCLFPVQRFFHSIW